MATQPSLTASLTEAVTADSGECILARVSELLSLRMSGTWPANSPATASMAPSGAA